MDEGARQWSDQDMLQLQKERGAISVGKRVKWLSYNASLGFRFTGNLSIKMD